MADKKGEAWPGKVRKGLIWTCDYCEESYPIDNPDERGPCPRCHEQDYIAHLEGAIVAVEESRHELLEALEGWLSLMAVYPANGEQMSVLDFEGAELLKRSRAAIAKARGQGG